MKDFTRIKRFVAFGAAAALFVGAAGLSQSGKGRYARMAEALAASPDEVMAHVDGQLERLPAEQRSAVRAGLTAGVLDRVIEQTLLARAVDDDGVVVSEEEVSSQIEEINAKLPAGKTLADFLADVGMSSEQMKAEIARDLKIEKWFDAQVTKVDDPTEAEIAEAYASDSEQFVAPETVDVRHVLVAFEPDDDAGAKADKKSRAAAIREDLIGGAAFEAVAKENSDCPSRDDGGKLGAFSRGQVVPEFEDAAFEQEVDEIGPVVETRFGYHIIRVEERTESRVVPLDEARESIAAALRAEKERMVVDEVVAGLKRKASITYAEAPSPDTGAAADGPA